MSGSEGNFKSGDLEIDFVNRQVNLRGEPVQLTKIEYGLLCYLATKSGQAISFSELMEKIWGSSYKNEVQYLWVNISRLRRKLEEDPSNPQYILTKTGVGYYLSQQ